MINAQIYQPKVSILIPVFNRKEFIAECIKSALNQTFTNFEIIVVDNASNDGTWEICKQFSETDQRVRIFRNDKNIGPVRNWIRCAKEAKGSFSKILFSDDCLEPNCLNEMVPMLDNADVALVYCAASVGKSKEGSTIYYSQAGSSRLTSAQFLNLILSKIAPVSPGAALIRTADLIRNLHFQFPTSTQRNFDKNGAGPDVMCLLLTAREYLHVAHIPKPLVFFRSHSGSFTVNNVQNDVTKGYRSAIAFYLIRNHSRELWVDYLSYGWWKEIKSEGAWICPSDYLSEYEGSGSLSEVLSMLTIIFRRLVDKVLGNKHIFIK